MDADLDTLATALFVKSDDLLKDSPQLAPYRPEVGIAPQLSDAELVTLSVLQAMLGFTSERKWLRHARSYLRHLFPYLPGQSGYNKRLRKAADLIRNVTRLLAVDTTLWTDDVWVIDSTPVECGRSRETAKRSDLAGWAQYGYCASHSRFFWGLRLHLVCTLHGLPVAFALTGAKADERETLLGMFEVEPQLVADRPGQTFDRRQELLRPCLRRPAHGPGHPAAAAGPQGRERAGRSAPVQAVAAGHRVDQRDLQRPARSRTPPWPYSRRCDGPRPAAHPRANRSDLAQRSHRPAGHAVTDRVRPLNPWNQSSRTARRLLE